MVRADITSEALVRGCSCQEDVCDSLPGKRGEWAILAVCALGVFHISFFSWGTHECQMNFCLFVFLLEADSSALSFPSPALYQYLVYLPGQLQQPLQQ